MEEFLEVSVRADHDCVKTALEPVGEFSEFNINAKLLIRAQLVSLRKELLIDSKLKSYQCVAKAGSRRYPLYIF